MARSGDQLRASVPAQPAAGKVEYRVHLTQGEETLWLPAERAVVARFKGSVPAGLLAPHILCMILAMLWSTRAGIEALLSGAQQHKLALGTLGLLAGGGLILGPLVQHFAFGALWTGWPLGEDLTDNKLAVAVLAWLVAGLRGRGGRSARGWILAASVLSLVVYAIPHSLHGSTLDYETMQTISG
jgi:hypothetical protein